MNTKRRDKKTYKDKRRVCDLVRYSENYQARVIHRIMLRDLGAVIVDLEGLTDRMWPGFAMQR